MQLLDIQPVINKTIYMLDLQTCPENESWKACFNALPQIWVRLDAYKRQGGYWRWAELTEQNAAALASWLFHLKCSMVSWGVWHWLQLSWCAWPAGKSTLMDILAMRKSLGKLKGQVIIAPSLSHTLELRWLLERNRVIMIIMLEWTALLSFCIHLIKHPRWFYHISSWLMYELLEICLQNAHTHIRIKQHVAQALAMEVSWQVVACPGTAEHSNLAPPLW